MDTSEAAVEKSATYKSSSDECTAFVVGSIWGVVRFVKIAKQVVAEHVTHTIIASTGAVAENVDGGDEPSTHDSCVF